ncbi:hypothetical protein AC578_3242 [Pseudocercospora eumusae]|uniref:Uncharacterized protein n=1 Tax=Pseudocercospora eumusae TaxID=321146 RepID=A0A139H1W9_9PEZI|nr:hypothetical protein AC578_3242 [Pseudocercospora eumusae]
MDTISDIELIERSRSPTRLTTRLHDYMDQMLPQLQHQQANGIVTGLFVLPQAHLRQNKRSIQTTNTERSDVQCPTFMGTFKNSRQQKILTKQAGLADQERDRVANGEDFETVVQDIARKKIDIIKEVDREIAEARRKAS